MAASWPPPGWVEAVAASTVGVDLGAPGLDGLVAVTLPAGAGRRGGRATGPVAAGAVLTVEHGVITAAGASEDGGAAPLVTFTLPVPEARLVLEGTSPSVAFMRGRLKVDGDPAAVLAVLAATARPGWAGAVEAARARDGGGG